MIILAVSRYLASVSGADFVGHHHQRYHGHRFCACFFVLECESSAIGFLPVVSLGRAVIGLLFTLGWFPADLVLFPGKYGDLFSVNLLGTVLCFSLFFLSKFLKR